MKLGINCMCLIGAMAKDYEGTVDRLCAGGCDYLEAMSNWGADPKVLEYYASLTGVPSGWDPENTKSRNAYLKSKGMHIEGMFIFDDTIMDQVEEMGAYCQEEGIHYVVFSFLKYENGIDTVYEKIEMIKKLAVILASYGVQIVIHNHEHDLALMRDKDGKDKYILDIFLENTTPQELMVEADTGWLLYAGVDPAAYIAAHADRIMILHFKEISKDYKDVPREDIFCACGEGAVDFEGVLAAVPEKDRDRMLYVLDQDASKKDIVEDEIKSMQHIRACAGVWNR